MKRLVELIETVSAHLCFLPLVAVFPQTLHILGDRSSPENFPTFSGLDWSLRKMIGLRKNFNVGQKETTTTGKTNAQVCWDRLNKFSKRFQGVEIRLALFYEM